MPNLPNQYEGFNIQIGPGNSDTRFNASEDEVYSWLGQNPSASVLNPGFAFYGWDGNSEDYYNDNCGTSIAPGSTKCGMGTGDNIPNNFGAGFPWRMTWELYGNLDSKIDFSQHSTYGPYDVWFNERELGNTVSPYNYNHPNRPTLADDQVKLVSVELVRHAKNPYMLKSVEFYKSTDDNVVDGLQNNNPDAWWTLISKQELDYEIDVVDNYNYVLEWVYDANIGAYVGNLKANQRGKRNIFLLKNIKEIPITGTYNLATVPTTHFEYQETNQVNTTTIHTPQGSNTWVSPSDYADLMILNSNKALLTKIVSPLGGETEIAYDEGASYAMNQVQYVRNTPVVKHKYQQPMQHAMQVFMVVKSKTIKDRSGSTKKWEYTFENKVDFDDQMPLSANYTYNRQLNRKVGFEKATVYQPELDASNQPYIKYYHLSTDNSKPYNDAERTLLWGKLYKVENYDGNGLLLSSTETTYAATKAFESGYFRMIDEKGNVTSIFSDHDYSDYIYNFPDQPVNEGVGNINGIFGGTKAYASKEYDYIENERPNVLSSYFIRKIEDSNIAYDKKCIPCEDTQGGGGDGEESIPTTTCRDFVETITEYEYYGADHRGITTNGVYGQLNPNQSIASQTNQTLNSGEYQLVYEPSWQLYSKKSRSPQLPDAYTKEEYFYLYDLGNSKDYLGTDDHVTDDFDALYKTHLKGMRSLVFEYRMTSKAPGQPAETQTQYYMYETGWENVTGSMVAYTTLGITEQILQSPNLPCPPEPNVPAGCFLSQNANLGLNDYCVTGVYAAGYVYCPCVTATAHISIRKRATAGDIMEGRVWLRSTHTKSTASAGNVLTFIPVNNNFVPQFGNDVFETYRVLSRTPLGWVYQEEDVNGLITKYDYVPSTLSTVTYCNGSNEVTKTVYGSENFGQVSAVTVGEGSPNQLITRYQYNPNGTIASITDPNNIVASYQYDEYNRMARAYRNGKLLQEVNYSKWNNNEALSFEQKTMQNYVETILHND